MPGAWGDDDESLRLNRRIDIRIVMAAPKPVEMERIEKTAEDQKEHSPRQATMAEKKDGASHVP